MAGLEGERSVVSPRGDGAYAMKRGRLGQIAGWTAYALVTLFLLLPVLIMVPASFGSSESLEFPPHAMSLRWYREVLGDRNWLGSAGVSAKLALLAGFVATLIGILLGLAHMRMGRASASLRAYLMCRWWHRTSFSQPECSRCSSMRICSAINGCSA